MTRPPIVAVSGFSGSGKTRLLARLIPALARRGVSTAVLKHTRHPHAFDRPGKDTDVLRRAGAVATAIDGPEGMAFFGPPAGGLRALAAFLPPVDLVLAEGWKDAPVPRIEVHRRRVARDFLCAEDPRVFAAVTDEPPPRPVRAFGHGEVEALAALVCARFGLGTPARRRPRLRAVPAVSRLRAEGSGRAVVPGRRRRMAKNKSGSRRGGRRTGGSRQGAGRKGGRATLRARGLEFFSEIGRKGGKKSGSKRRAAARRASRKMRSSRGGSRPRGGTRSRRGTRSTR
ncbi:MAG TPA: molybdopterin-guanine dinucleotide biosynthesis protein B [Anaeromyxobacter sp.]